MLLSNALAVLDLTDVFGSRGVHIGDGVIFASAVAVVVTYDLTNNILIFSAGKDTVAYAANGAIFEGIAGNIAVIIATCADVTNQTAKLISALNGNVGQTAVGNTGITVADNTTGVLTACNGGVGDGDISYITSCTTGQNACGGVMYVAAGNVDVVELQVLHNHIPGIEQTGSIFGGRIRYDVCITNRLAVALELNWTGGSGEIKGNRSNGGVVEINVCFKTNGPATAVIVICSGTVIIVAIIVSMTVGEQCGPVIEQLGQVQ